MRRVVFSALLALAPALGLGARASGLLYVYADQNPAAPSPDPGAAAPANRPPQAPSVPPLTGGADPAKLALPKPTPDAKAPGALPVDQKTYMIGAQDVVQVQVWGEPGLACQCLVRPDGMISMAFIGDVLAAGRTPDELKKDVAEKLTKVMKEPQVSVQLYAVNSKKFYLQGQVRAPGERNLIVPTTVMEGLVGAGGFQDFADTKHIIIVRGSKRLKFNYKEVLDGKNLQQNVFLEPGDIIVVK